MTNWFNKVLSLIKIFLIKKLKKAFEKKIFNNYINDLNIKNILLLITNLKVLYANYIKDIK